jgi:hypothetical protein
MSPAHYRAAPLVLLLAVAAHAADGVTAIETAGFGAVTVCVDWPFYGCSVHDRVALPKRLAIGDRLSLELDSGPGRMDFPVVRIIKNGVRCTVLMQPDGDSDNNKIDNIKVPSCLDVADTR